ncbi:MAG: prolipoprotein diacylglyceryl transferase family protein [Chloroflexota bacterium]
MLPILQVGRVAIQVPGLVYLIGVWLAVTAVERAARRRGLPADRLSSSLTLGVLVAVGGARLAYALAHLSIYLERPLDLFSLDLKAMDLAGGVLAGAATAWIQARRHRLSLPTTLDALAVGVAVFAVADALAHLASGTAFGAPADLPWAIELWGVRRHPTQVYELLLNLVILALVLRRQDPRPGQSFALWLALAGGARVLVEGFRGDSLTFLGGLRVAQVVGLCLALVGLGLFGRLARTHPAPAQSA